MKLVREKLYEFDRGANPLKNIGIGTRVLISNFMKEINEVDTDDKKIDMIIHT
jgi:hypothetical protein